MAKAEGRAQPHQPGAPMQHLPATSSHPLQPFRQLILRAHLPGAHSAVDDRLSSCPSNASDSSVGGASGELQDLPAGADPGSARSQGRPSTIFRRPSLGEWFRGEPSWSPLCQLGLPGMRYACVGFPCSICFALGVRQPGNCWLGVQTTGHQWH